MFTLRQLARQPVKSLIGILLAALSVCVCCVSAGQYRAAEIVQREIENGYTTVALPTNRYNDLTLYDEAGNVIGASYTSGMPDTAKKALAAIADEHPEWYRETARHGLISSYIPDMKPLNPTGQNYAFSMHSPSPEGRPYGCLMAVIRVTELGEASVQEKPKSGERNVQHADSLEEIIAALQKQLQEARERGEEYPFGRINPGGEASEDGTAEIQITGVIEEVIGLEAGYENPTGWTITLSVTLPDRAAYEALELAVGERYLCYGMEYVSDDFQFRQYYVKWGSFSPASKATVEPLTEEDRLYYTRLWGQMDDPLSRKMLNTPQESQNYRHILRVYGEDGELGFLRFMTDNEVKMYQTAHMTVRDYSAEPQERYYSNEEGDFVEVLEDTRYARIDGEEVTMDVAEYRAMYGLPSIVRLEESAEAFLASEDGALWRNTLEDMQVNFHAFPLIGVDRLGCIADFARRLARIAEGRDFTSEELESGAKVCVLSQSLAEANGIRVGDTIPLSTYDRDANMNANTGGMESKDPGAYFYSHARGFNTDAPETYTVVGLYRQENEWTGNAENDYAFTPNTIFTPKKSIAGEMTDPDDGFYVTRILQNGSVEAFDAAVTEAGYPGLFIYYDQGYSEIQESLGNFHAVSGQAMRIGLLASGMIWLLWIFFFPLRQRPTVQRMLRMGARPGQALAQVMGSAAGILLPGAVCGIGLSALSWSKITAKIVQLADFDAVIPFAGRDVLLLAGIQLMAALVVTLPIGAVMSRSRKLGKCAKRT